MDESPIPAPGQPRTGRATAIVGALLAALALVVALFVIVRSFRKVTPEPLPSSLKQPPPDTGLVAFRVGMRRKVMNLSARCQARRKQFGERLTPAQDSLGRECDSAIAAALSRISALDTVRREDRKVAADSVLAEYERAKLKVRVFTRSARPSELINEDSLDREIKKLISE